MFSDVMHDMTMQVIERVIDYASYMDDFFDIYPLEDIEKLLFQMHYVRAHSDMCTREMHTLNNILRNAHAATERDMKEIMDALEKKKKSDEADAEDDGDESDCSCCK